MVRTPLSVLRQVHGITLVGLDSITDLSVPSLESVVSDQRMFRSVIGLAALKLGSNVAEAPWSGAEWAVALRFDNPRPAVLVLLLSDTPYVFWGSKRHKHSFKTL